MIHKVLNLYPDRDYVTLSCFLLNEQGELHDVGPRPAVLVLPGGGYLNCSDSEGDPVALTFAAMGYHAFVLRYSTYFKGKGGFPQPGKPLERHPETEYPQPMRDIGKAVLEIRAHADTWNIDPEHIILCGFSAGAHNAAMYCNNYTEPIITDYLKANAEDLRPAGQILGYMLSDYIFMRDYLKTAPAFSRDFFAVSNTAFVGAGDPSQEVLDEISPSRHISEKTCPSFIWATSTDHMVPVQHSIHMAQALADKGIPFELYIFGEGEHGSSIATKASASSMDRVIPNVAVWTDLCRKWLDKWAPISIPDPIPMDEWIKSLNEAGIAK